MKNAEILKQGVARAVSAAGTYSELARMLGVSRAAVNKWKQVPEARVDEIERLTGVPRYLLRPDLFEHPTRRRAAMLDKIM